MQWGGEAEQERLAKLLGFEPPLTSLRYWLLGVPDPSAPAIESLDSTAHLAQLQQGEWQVSYGQDGLSGGPGVARAPPLRRGPAAVEHPMSHWAPRSTAISAPSR